MRPSLFPGILADDAFQAQRINDLIDVGKIRFGDDVPAMGVYRSTGQAGLSGYIINVITPGDHLEDIQFPGRKGSQSAICHIVFIWGVEIYHFTGGG